MKEKNSNMTGKEFSITKIVYIVLFLIIIGMVILLGSDTFKSPEISNTPTNIQQNNSDVHGGADLSKLQEISDLEKQLAANPSNSELALKLGHLLNDSGFHEKAIEKYKEYLKSDSQNTDVIVDMGVCYYQFGDLSSAITTMEGAIKIDPNHQIGNFNLGIVNLSAGNHDIAISYWKKAVEINPNSNIGQKAKNLIEQH